MIQRYLSISAACISKGSGLQKELRVGSTKKITYNHGTATCKIIPNFEIKIINYWYNQHFTIQIITYIAC